MDYAQCIHKNEHVKKWVQPPKTVVVIGRGSSIRECSVGYWVWRIIVEVIQVGGKGMGGMGIRCKCQIGVDEVKLRWCAIFFFFRWKKWAVLVDATRPTWAVNVAGDL